MKIASFVNEHQEVVNLYEKGTVCLFENISGRWTRKQEISFEINKNMGIPELKRALNDVASQLRDCKVFLVHETKGLLNVFLEELGLRTWKSEGDLSEQLDNVARKEAEIVSSQEDPWKRTPEEQGLSGCGGGCHRSAKSTTEAVRSTWSVVGPAVPKPELVGDVNDGYYRINLADALDSGQNFNSRQILIPFLKEQSFRKLEIYCDHSPKWFSKEIESLNVRIVSEIRDISGHGVKITVSPMRHC